MLKRALIVTLMMCLAAAPLSAEEAAPGAAVEIELNTTTPQEAGCLLSFVVRNTHPGDIAQALYEAVLFDGAGQVHQLTLFDFGTLPASRPRVRQFIVPDLPCAEMSRIIFNGATTCDSADLAPNACTDGLVLRSRTGTEVLG